MRSPISVSFPDMPWYNICACFVLYLTCTGEWRFTRVQQRVVSVASLCSARVQPPAGTAARGIHNLWSGLDG